MIYNERTQRHEQVVASARQMLTAARTAPKARGVDIIEAILVEGDDLKLLAERMVEIGNNRNRPSFIRDAGNVLQAECIVAIGTRYQSLGLNCGHCGFATCAEREQKAEVPCSLNSIDVGIAVGSACATAADLRLDTRVMYSMDRRGSPSHDGHCHFRLIQKSIFRPTNKISKVISTKNPFS